MIDKAILIPKSIKIFEDQLDKIEQLTAQLKKDNSRTKESDVIRLILDKGIEALELEISLKNIKP